MKQALKNLKTFIDNQSLLKFFKERISEIKNKYKDDPEAEKKTEQHIKTLITYNEHYQRQHEQNWMNPNSTIIDDPYQIIYPRNPWLLNWREKTTMQIIYSFANIIWIWKTKEWITNNESYEQTMKELFDVLETKSVLIITNHATFVNFPIIIWELEKYAKKFWKHWILDKIYTILWPALLTQNQKNYIQSISNLLKTIPDTWNSQIPWIEEEIKRIRKRFLRELSELRKTPWNIFILAPTWTRDLLYRDETEKDIINTILFGSDEDLSNSLSIIKSFAKKDWHIVFAWVNETSLKDPSKVQIWNNDWTPWAVMVSMQYTSPQNTLELFRQKQIMQTLANNVLDINWNPIWKTVRSERLRCMKSWEIKTWEIFDWNNTQWNKELITQNSTSLLQDKKARIVRLLFNTLKNAL